MMSVFADYARYYNLLYRDKDYIGETNFILDIFRDENCSPKTLLDLGCGTGRHATAFSQHGIAVRGVDLSEDMILAGQEALSKLKAASETIPVLQQGDACSVRLHTTFDTVVSLFHVISYQNLEQQALDFLTTAKIHLKLGGLFFFDFWHGPGVLRDLPVHREKILEDSQTRIVRMAHPDHLVGDNVVIVHYDIDITDIQTQKTSKITESHPMRYWFMPELRSLATRCGFSIVKEGGWMHTSPPGLDDWNAWMLLRA